MTGTHRLPGVSFWRRLYGPAFLSPHVFAALLAFNLIIQLGNQHIWKDSGYIAAAVILCLYAVGLGAFLLITHVRNPPPVIDLDAGVLRIGSESIPFAEVDEAAVVRVLVRRRDELLLWFGAHKRRHATVALRSRRGALVESDREVLAAMVERSSIQLPVSKPDPYDPKGKFAWLDQQGYATKEQVLDAVLHTPATGDITRR